MVGTADTRAATACHCGPGRVPSGAPVPSSNGRRHGAPEDEQEPAAPAESGGGRRRRADGDTNEVLARLLDNR